MTHQQQREVDRAVGELEHILGRRLGPVERTDVERVLEDLGRHWDEQGDFW